MASKLSALSKDSKRRLILYGVAALIAIALIASATLPVEGTENLEGRFRLQQQNFGGSRAPSNIYNQGSTGGSNIYDQGIYDGGVYDQGIFGTGQENIFGSGQENIYNR